ncbi:hypothetical protein EGX46_11790 [Yersinia pestis]|nr:hypothetical protein EGX46_11790 [Yersinia pestis]
MDVFTASLRSACSLRRGHFVNNLKGAKAPFCYRWLQNQHDNPPMGRYPALSVYFPTSPV